MGGPGPGSGLNGYTTLPEHLVGRDRCQYAKSVSVQAKLEGEPSIAELRRALKVIDNVSKSPGATLVQIRLVAPHEHGQSYYTKFMLMLFLVVIGAAEVLHLALPPPHEHAQPRNVLETFGTLYGGDSFWNNVGSYTFLSLLGITLGLIYREIKSDSRRYAVSHILKAMKLLEMTATADPDRLALVYYYSHIETALLTSKPTGRSQSAQAHQRGWYAVFAQRVGGFELDVAGGDKSTFATHRAVLIETLVRVVWDLWPSSEPETEGTGSRLAAFANKRRTSTRAVAVLGVIAALIPVSHGLYNVAYWFATH